MPLRHEYVVLDMIESAVKSAKTSPLNLGGVGGQGGGIGGPPGGFIGQLPQYRVSYDTLEDATLDTKPSGLSGSSGWSLVDNLNHIRYRLSSLETASGGGSVIVDDWDGSPTINNANHITFSGATVLDLGSGHALVVFSGGGGLSSLELVGSNVYYADSQAFSDLGAPYFYFEQTLPAAFSASSAAISSANTHIYDWVTHSGLPNVTSIKDTKFYISVYRDFGTKNVRVYAKLYKRTTGGTETLLVTSAETPNLTNSSVLYTLDLGGTFTIGATDRLVVKLYASPYDAGTNPSITIDTGDVPGLITRLEFTSVVGTFTQVEFPDGIIVGNIVGNDLQITLSGTVGSSLVVDEQDGSPTVSGVNHITFSGVYIEDLGGGHVLVPIDNAVPYEPIEGSVYLHKDTGVIIEVPNLDVGENYINLYGDIGIGRLSGYLEGWLQVYTGANLITNGDFEDNSLTGWTLTGSPTVSSPGWESRYCARCSDVNTIKQTISTSVGTYYLLRFSQRMDNAGDSPGYVLITGGDQAAYNPGGVHGNKWLRGAALIKATATSMTFEFTTNLANPVYFDSISLMAVTTFGYIGLDSSGYYAMETSGTAHPFIINGRNAQPTVEEKDGSPSIDNVDKIIFSGASVTDLGNGDVVVTVDGEYIQDIVGGMVSGNTETGISVTYDDSGGKLNFDAQTAGDARYSQLGHTHDHTTLTDRTRAIPFPSITDGTNVIGSADVHGTLSQDLHFHMADAATTTIKNLAGIPVPTDVVSGGTCNFVFLWSSTVANNNVNFTVVCREVGNTDTAMNVLLSNTADQAVGASANKVVRTAISMTAPTPGKSISFALLRNGTAGGDTNTGTVCLWGVFCEYTADM